MSKRSQLIDKYGFAIYPLLFSLFPLLSFYGANAAEIESGDFTLAPFFVLSLTVVVGSWVVSYLLTKNVQKASILTTVFLAVFFTFGRIEGRAGSIISEFIIPFGPNIGPTKLLFIICGLFLLGAWFLVMHVKSEGLKKANSTLTIIAGVVVASTLITVFPAVFSNIGNTSTSSALEAINIETNNNSLPDVYYILLDGYARADFLKKNFGYDNSGFITSLNKRGFYVAKQANANYAHTFLSVPSTFNMEYVNFLTEELGSTSTSRARLKEMTQIHKVAGIFKTLGYKYVNIGSQWHWTNTSPIQDIEIIPSRQSKQKILKFELDELAMVYLQTTILKPFIEADIQNTLVTQITDAIEKTQKVSEFAESTLTFTHLLIPHPPYIFNRDGVIQGQTKLELDNHGFSDKEKFMEQTIYTNKLTLDLVDAIITNSDSPPIIIIASDHGPASSLGRRDFENIGPDELDEEGVKERMGILNAYYFPDQNYKELYQQITPVNTFRLILRQYFGQDIELLPDHSYFSDNKKNLYKFVDVTESL